MGGTTSQQQSKIGIEWERVRNQNGIEIYKNRNDGTLAEKRTILLDPKHSLESQLKVYEFRKNNTEGLVRSYAVEDVSEEVKNGSSKSVSGICSSNHRLDVLTERIQYRLSQFPQITFAESLNLLRQTLRSYQIINKKLGPVHINSETIGFTDTGEVRSWINQNWASNHASHEMATLKTTKLKEGKQYELVSPDFRDESEMIRNIINVIEDKTQEGRFPPDFSQSLRQNSRSFRQVRKFLEFYINERNLEFIPSNIRPSQVIVTKVQGIKYRQQKDINTQSFSKSLNPQFESRNQVQNSYRNTILPIQPQIIPAQVPEIRIGNNKITTLSNGVSNENKPSNYNFGAKNYEFNIGKNPQPVNLISGGRLIGKDVSPLSFNQRKQNQMIKTYSKPYEFNSYLASPNPLKFQLTPNITSTNAFTYPNLNLKPLDYVQRPQQINPKPIEFKIGDWKLKPDAVISKPDDSIRSFARDINFSSIDKYSSFNKTPQLKNLFTSPLITVNEHEAAYKIKDQLAE